MNDFPADFLWGSSTAAHQVEGGNTNNDWWDWEHAPGTKATESSGDAIDQWHRYPDDFALLASLGQNAHRFSLEWSRIEPAEGEFSRAALDHYRRVLASLRHNDLTPFTTLYHFTLPRWFAKRGGWLAEDALDIFTRYVQRVAAALGDELSYVGTINEPQVLSAMGYLTGSFPPGMQDRDTAIRVNRLLAEAHRRAVGVLRAGPGRPQIGTCLQIAPAEPFRPGDEADIALADRLRVYNEETHIEDLRAAEDPGDFVGLQYYSRLRVDARNPAMQADLPEGTEVSQMGWEVYPEGFAQALTSVASSGLPVLVTENGIATADDSQRVRYLASHLEVLQRARETGVDVRGYFHWSAFDNFEWSHGYGPTFGLIGVERDNGFRRVVKASAVLYGEVARTGSLQALRRAASGDGNGPGAA